MFLRVLLFYFFYGMLLLAATNYSQAFKHTSIWTAKMLSLIYERLNYFSYFCSPGVFTGTQTHSLVFARNIKKFLWKYKTLYYWISATFLFSCAQRSDTACYIHLIFPPQTADSEPAFEQEGLLVRGLFKTI